MTSERRTIEGVARNAKVGAVLLLDDGEVVYVGGRAAWDDEQVGTRMRLAGTLSRREIYPSAEPGRQGMEGVPLVLEVEE